MSSDQPSKILFLLGCSNSKAEPRDPYGAESESVLPQFSPSLATQLLRRRKMVFDLLVRPRTKRARTRLRELPYNRELSIGPDIEPGERPSSKYLEARQLYSGRLYSQVEPATWKNRRHHVLIFSALYGLVSPEEQLQRYSCHLADHRRLPKIWAEDDFVTEALREYLRLQSIELVFELLGEGAYRRVFDWSKLPNVEVLHVFGEQNAGPAVLPALGWWLNAQLTSLPEDLMGYGDGDTLRTPMEPLRLSATGLPPGDCPDESQELAAQIQRHYQPFLDETEVRLIGALGHRRWQTLQESEPAADFLVSAVAMLSMGVPMRDYSPVVIQLSKALEAVLHHKITGPAGRQLLRDVPTDQSSRDRPGVVRRLRGATVKARSVPLWVMGALIGGATEPIDGLSVTSLECLRFRRMNDSDVNELSMDIRRVDEDFRQGLAHTQASSRASAEVAEQFILGEIDGFGKLERSGVLVRVLDALA